VPRDEIPEGGAGLRVAIVGIGTNSTRLLIADVENGRAVEVERRNTVTQLGRGVDLTDQLSAEAIEDVCEAVDEYVARFQELGAERVMAIATSAVRDAANADAFIAELRERFALDTRVLSSDEEAGLTYLGATAERPATGSTLVFDIGGGSTELVVGAGTNVGFHASLQAGVVRHTERHLTSDPPSATEMELLADDVRHQIDGVLGKKPLAVAERGIAVAGTPTSLAAVEQELEEPYDRDRVHGHRLPLRSIQRMLSRLASVPLAERLHIRGLHPRRAPTIVAGVVILVEVMRAFRLDEVEVSERDILHGSALAASLAPA
jgi:exopolyphosphatase/guanosine-5'-triphosphate,3'-diphosphate pyrophosphatase